MTGPVTSPQLPIAMPPEMPTISVPETLMTCAAMPARETVTGDVNPVPSITNRVPPVNGPDAFGAVSRAVGDITSISLNVTLITWASAAPKNTCTGAWNASPKIETRVPPSMGPDVGDTPRMTGVSTANWYVTAAGFDTDCSFVVPASSITVIVTGSCWPVMMSKAGVTTLICVEVMELTNPSFGAWPLPGSKITFTGARKFVPVITNCWPPVGRPTATQPTWLARQTEEIVGAVRGSGGGTGCVENVTWIVFETLFTVAVIVSVPAVDDVSVALATPPVVVRMVVFWPVSVKMPPVVVNCTAVPSTTGCPPEVTVAVTTTLEVTSGVALETVRLIVAPVGGVTVPPGGTVDVVGGAVGDDSPLQPIIVSARTATKAISTMRSVVVFMSVSPSLSPRYAQPLQS